MKIIVSGANGYIGTMLCPLLKSNGHQIITLSRHQDFSYDGSIYFDLTENSEIEIPPDVDVVIHLAVVANHISEDTVNNEIAKSIQLIQAAKKASAKFIFVSSQTARENAPTQYGRTKWVIEQSVISNNGIVVRPGQVYGGVEKGLFGKLMSIIKKFAILPAFAPAPMIQPIHIQDLTGILLNLATNSTLPFAKIYCCAADKPIKFKEFLERAAYIRFKRFCFFFPTPVFLIKLLIKIIGANVSNKLGITGLASLFDLPTMHTRQDLDLLGVRLREFDAGISKSGNSLSLLVLEAYILLKYIMATKPNLGLVRRYVRAIITLQQGIPLIFHPILFRFPCLMNLLQRKDISIELKWRLDCATLIVEATPIGAKLFIGKNKYIPFRSVFLIVYSVYLELSWQVLSLLFSPMKKKLSPFLLRKNNESSV